MTRSDQKKDGDEQGSSRHWTGGVFEVTGMSETSQTAAWMTSGEAIGTSVWARISDVKLRHA
eukprot:1734863-Pleurochrysis_carterae.AAC.8